jgi:hypothetical protein
MLNAQEFNLILYLGYEPICRQRGRCQPELGFLLFLDLGVLSNPGSDLENSGSNLDYKSYSNSTGNRTTDWIRLGLRL